jgi:hypothetical protein
MHGARNFSANCHGVKQHGAILGMQMQCNKIPAVIPGQAKREPGS